MSEPNDDSANPATESESVEASSSEPVKKRKPRRKRARAEASEAVKLREPLDADGRDRPAFLLDYPIDPELEVVIEAFERGDYRSVRELAPALARRHADPDVQAAAQELFDRTEPDPLVKFLFGVAVALFIAIVALAYLFR